MYSQRPERWRQRSGAEQGREWGAAHCVPPRRSRGPPAPPAPRTGGMAAPADVEKGLQAAEQEMVYRVDLFNRCAPRRAASVATRCYVDVCDNRMRVCTR